jgi:hypothetical protein
VDCLVVDGFEVSITVKLGIEGKGVVWGFIVLMAFHMLEPDLTR